MPASAFSTYRGYPPLTLRAGKQAIAIALAGPTGDDARLVDRLVDYCMASEDYVEGRRALAEKQAPRFVGR